VLGDGINSIVADPAGFSFESVDDHCDDYMVPGAAKYGGVEGLRMLAGK